MGETHIVRRNLPYSTSDSNKIVAELIRVHSKLVEMINSYSNYHLPHKLTAFEEHIAYQISHLARNFVRTFRTNFSPFEPGKHDERSTSSKNPFLKGQSSTSSITSSTSSSMDEDSTSDEEPLSDVKTQNSSGRKETVATLSLSTVLPFTLEIYLMEVKRPRKKNYAQYKKYVQMAKQSMPEEGQTRSSQLAGQKKILGCIQLTPLSDFGRDSYESVEPPRIPEVSLDIYRNYVESPSALFKRDDVLSGKTRDVISNYVNFSL